MATELQGKVAHRTTLQAMIEGQGTRIILRYYGCVCIVKTNVGSALTPVNMNLESIHDLNA